MHKNDQSVVVRHKEFVTEVRGSTTFSVKRSFDLNPGLHQTFPWLAAIASNYQQYRIKGMVFHYVPSSGTAVSGTNSSLGTVMMQTSYRATDEPPSSKVEILNEYWSTESVPSQAFAHPIECNPAENPFNVQYVRTSALPSAENQLMYDLGTTHLAVSGQQADDTVLGDLWISYEIELKKPVVASSVSQRSYLCRGVANSGTLSSLLGSMDFTSGNLELTAAGNQLNFPLGITGVFYITVQVPAASPFFGSPVDTSTFVASITNCTLVDITSTGIQKFVTVTAGTGTIRAINVQFAVRIVDPGLQANVVLPTWSVAS
jgi:hypothetical protein